MVKKNIMLLAVALSLVCGCAGQDVLPPMPEDAIAIDGDMVVGTVDQQTGDVPIQYTLFITNVGNESLEKVILKDFISPHDVVMEQNYFEIKNLRAGETRKITFDVVVLGWGLNQIQQTWEVDFTIRLEKGSAYTEQEVFYYGIELYPGLLEPTVIPMPEDVLTMNADMVVGTVDQQTGDVPIQYTLFITNVGNESLEKVILKDFISPHDVVMEQNYFEIKNLRAGETRKITFDVVVLGWGLNQIRQTWEVDFTIRLEQGNEYTEQDIFYYAIELYVE